MTRRQVAVMYLATVIWTVLTMGVASAQVPDPLAHVVASLAQSRLVVDVPGALTIPDAKALQAKLAKTSPPILIAVLPDSAVGDRVNGAAVEAAVYRLATSAGVSATVGLVLPQSGYFRATSSVLSPDAVDSMAMQAARNQASVAQEMNDFIAQVQTLSASHSAAAKPASRPSGHGFPVGPLFIAVGIAGFLVWGVCTGRIRRPRRAREQTGGHQAERGD